MDSDIDTLKEKLENPGQEVIDGFRLWWTALENKEKSEELLPLISIIAQRYDDSNPTVSTIALEAWGRAWKHYPRHPVLFKYRPDFPELINHEEGFTRAGAMLAWKYEMQYLQVTKVSRYMHEFIELMDYFSDVMDKLKDTEIHVRINAIDLWKLACIHDPGNPEIVKYAGEVSKCLDDPEKTVVFNTLDAFREAGIANPGVDEIINQVPKIVDALKNEDADINAKVRYTMMELADANPGNEEILKYIPQFAGGPKKDS